MKYFEICAEILAPKFTRAEVRLPGPDQDQDQGKFGNLGPDQSVPRSSGPWSIFSHKPFISMLLCMFHFAVCIKYEQKLGLLIAFPMIFELVLLYSGLQGMF